jgi:hypothetical protein
MQHLAGCGRKSTAVAWAFEEIAIFPVVEPAAEMSALSGHGPRFARPVEKNEICSDQKPRCGDFLVYFHESGLPLHPKTDESEDRYAQKHDGRQT